ncbi:unspecified product [Leishmania tarentolae]|uniref:Unspecified product n=1 Tax=Leishmania tarentolae TaxID=5689 RepID=A0A640K8U0_LEITA|nr:unspecified product [Leishmania tarentolae]
MGRRRKNGGRGNGNAAANNSPPDSESPMSTTPLSINGIEAGSVPRLVAEAEVKSAKSVTIVPSVEPVQGLGPAEVVTGDAPNTSDAVAALNAYVYQNSVNQTAADGTVFEDDDADEEATQMANPSASSASPPRTSGKKVAFFTPVASANFSSHDEKLREARCLESACTYCTVM